MDASQIPDRVLGRFWDRVDVGTPGECWPWLLSTGSHGYGQVGWWNKDRRNVMVLAHRLAYVIGKGEIPGEMTVDHVCRNRICCNPAHLRLLTNVDNARLNGNAVKTHCVRGHEFSPENTRRDHRGHRVCLACLSIRSRMKAVV